MIRRKRSMLFVFVLLVPGAVGAGSLLVRPASTPMHLPAQALAPATTLRKMSADEIQTLFRIREESHRKVAALTASFPHLSDVEREGVEKQVVRIKTDEELAFLRAQVQIAEARGNPIELAEAEHALASFTQALRTDRPALDSGQPQEKTPGGRP